MGTNFSLIVRVGMKRTKRHHGPALSSLVPDARPLPKELLTNYSTCTLVIDVKISCCVSQQAGALDYRIAVSSKDCTHQTIFCRLTNQLTSVLKIYIIIDINRDYRAEDFLRQCLCQLFFGHDDRRLDEITHLIVVFVAQSMYPLILSKATLLIIHRTRKVTHFPNRSLSDFCLLLYIKCFFKEANKEEGP